MKPTPAAALYSTGLLLAFGAGWFLKPATAPDHSTALSPPALSANRSGPGVPKDPAILGTASVGNWLDAISADVAAIRAAKRPGVVNQVLIDKLSAVLNLTDKFKRLASWNSLITEMCPEDSMALQALFDERNKEGRYIGFTEYENFLHQWGMIDGASSAASSLAHNNIRTVMVGWAEKNAEQALAWLESQAPAKQYREVFSGIVEGLFALDPQAAESLLLSRADDTRVEDVLARAVENRQAREGFESAKRWFSDIASGDASDAFKRENFSALFSINDSTQPNQKQVLMELTQPYLNQPWLPQNAGTFLGEYWAGTAPEGGMHQILEMKSIPAMKSAAESLAGKWAEQNPQTLSIWLTGNRSHPLFDQATYRLTQTLQTVDQEAAQAWAAQIKDPDLKSRALEPQTADPFAAGE